MKFVMELVQFEPEIAQNTGTLVRLCACFNIPFGIVQPASFILSDKRFKRASMDYVNFAKIKLYNSFEDLKNSHKRIVLLDVKASTNYYEFQYCENDCLMVGRESTGVPDEIYFQCDEHVVIPMRSSARSLNVAISAAIVLSESLRQLKYTTLE